MVRGKKIVTGEDDVMTKLAIMEEKIDKFLEVTELQRKKIDSLEKKVSLVIEENDELKEELQQTQDLVDELQQRSRLINIIINGVPQKKNEDVYKIVEQIGLKLKIEDPMSHVQVAHRVNTINKEKPKPIVVRLLNTKSRDLWTKSYRVNKMWEQKFYVNEHLTKRNQNVLYKTKEFKKKYNYKFVWVRDCKIFIRKNETSRVYVIRNEEDLKRVLEKKKIETEEETGEEEETLTHNETNTSYESFQNFTLRRS